MSRPRVYIGRLSSRAREYDVEKFFRGYGKVRDVMLKNGYGFVELDDFRDADDAVQDLNGRELCGERVMLEIAKGIPRGAGGAFVSGYVPPPSNAKFYSSSRGSSSGGGRPGYGRPSNGYKVIVENLSTRCSWQDLKDMMKKYGDVLYVDAHHYRRNEGVVEFSHKSDMEYAVEKLNGKDINGRKMKLIPETDRYSRSPSPERKRRRSRSRSGEREKRSKRSRSRSSRNKDDDYEKSNGHENGDHEKSSRARSRSGSPPPKSKARSKTPDDEREDSPKDERRERSKSGSPRERSRSGSRHSHSENEERNGSRSRSRSGSPEERASRSRSRSQSS